MKSPYPMADETWRLNSNLCPEAREHAKSERKENIEKEKLTHIGLETYTLAAEHERFNIVNKNVHY